MNFKKTLDFILASLANNLNENDYLTYDKNKAQEFERIVQFLTLISNDVSLSPEMYERNLAVTLRILNIIKKKNFAKETPR